LALEWGYDNTTATPNQVSLPLAYPNLGYQVYANIPYSVNAYANAINNSSSTFTIYKSFSWGANWHSISA